MKPVFQKSFKDLDDINSKEASKESKQNRGRAFESLLLDVFEDEGILQKRNRHTKDNKSEEIDGVIEVYKRIFLIEAKWVASGLAASVLYSFIGKIENKFHGTLGVFISRNPLKKNFLRALNKGRRQSVIVLHGKDVDLLFEGKVKFGEYIEYAFKELSSENVVHLPVEEYIKVKDHKESSRILIEKVETSGKKGLKFVKEKLLASPISSTELVIELAELGEEEKEAAYAFVIQKYSELWFANFTGDKTFTIKNLNDFLATHVPQVATLKNLAAEYYTSLVFKSLMLYTRDPFIGLFQEFFPDLKDEAKREFEIEILKYWNDKFGSYDVENSITDLLKSIWSYLSDTLKGELYNCYLDIYVSDRKNNHSQKKFAIELVEKEIIPPDLLKEWLSKKLRTSGKMYFSLNPEKIGFIISTYKGVLKLIEPDESNWQTYVLNILFERKVFTEHDNTIVLYDSELLTIYNIEGSNGENLAGENIKIKHIYFKGDDAKEYIYDLIPAITEQNNSIDLKIIVVKKTFENGDNDRTEISFENLNGIKLKVRYRKMK